MSRFHPLTVAAVEPLTDDAAAVTFAVPDALRSAYAFAPGQSLTLRRVLDGAEHRRTYSICAPAGAAPRIGVREIPDGLFSRWLVRDVRPGDVVEVEPPRGGFRADPATPARHLCVAAGSGITPMVSIAASVLRQPAAEVALLYGNRTTGSVMFSDELGDLKNLHGPRLQVVHVLSREPRDVELFSGRLDADRLRRLLGPDSLVPARAFDHVWLCGPHAMVTDARLVLAELGVPAERVHAELFYVDEPPPDLVRPASTGAGGGYELTVVLDGVTTTTAGERDRTVLEAVQATRADVPFACRGGVCGTCRARVVDGEVEMRRNYALDPAEVARGFVLACQAVPVTDRLVVDFDA